MDLSCSHVAAACHECTLSEGRCFSQGNSDSASTAAAAAAFVADIYGTGVKQGPSLPLANRSALMSEFRTNSTKFRSRVLAGLTQVSHQLPFSPVHVLSRMP